MDFTQTLDLLIGLLSKDNLFVGKIIKVRTNQYIPNGDTIGERLIFSRIKPETENIRNALLYKIDNEYLDLKTKKKYSPLKKTSEYSTNEITNIPDLDTFYVEEESLLPAQYYGLIPENTNYVSRKKVLKKFEKLTN